MKEDLFIGDHGHDPGTDLGLYHRDLGAPGVPGRLLINDGRKSGFLQLQFLFVNGHKRYHLLGGVDGGLGLNLTFLQLSSKVVQNTEHDGCNDEDYEKDVHYDAPVHGYTSSCLHVRPLCRALLV